MRRCSVISLPFANQPELPATWVATARWSATSTTIGINGNTGRQLPHNISLNINANLDRNESHSRTGASSTTAACAGRLAVQPLQPTTWALRATWASRCGRNVKPPTRTLSVNLSTQLGKWRLMSDTNLGWNRSVTDSERRVDTDAAAGRDRRGPGESVHCASG